jgi:hypothetical protein
MYLEPADLRPPTLLGGKPLGLGAVAVGLFVALASHVGLPALVSLAIWLWSLGAPAGAVPGEEAPRRRVDPRTIVAAEFVQLGRPFDPRRLPDRRVPVRSTAPPPDGVAVSKNPQQRERRDRPDMGVPPENAALSKLLVLGDRAQMFAELTAPIEREGDPDGVEGGSLRARDGDRYLGQFVMFFRRGWSVARVVDRETLQSLSAEADVDIADDGRITGFRITRESGNAQFDQSVVERLEGLRSAGASIPEPPESVRDQYYGQTRAVRYNGRDAR